MQSRSVLLKNMFNPEEYVFNQCLFQVLQAYRACRETERDWDKDLADDVKIECEAKYGPVRAIKVEKESLVSYFGPGLMY